jgi:hypothetical protein
MPKEEETVYKSKYNSGFIVHLLGIFTYVEERDFKKLKEWTLIQESSITCGSRNFLRVGGTIYQ